VVEVRRVDPGTVVVGWTSVVVVGGGATFGAPLDADVAIP